MLLPGRVKAIIRSLRAFEEVNAKHDSLRGRNGLSVLKGNCFRGEAYRSVDRCIELIIIHNIAFHR